MAPPSSQSRTKPDGSSLNVIALVSGGKDSFFSLLHCRANGHRVVALANLYPGSANGGDGTTHGPARDGSGKDALTTVVLPGSILHSGTEVNPGGEEKEDEEETDLNSFMYQTVGHQVIPLYADATGIPLYRRPITGVAAQSGKDYSHADPLNPESTNDENDADETESMLPLLRTILSAHPEANALCAGAILSTYQRTRVESVASRLGLAPLAYLWKFPSLPASSLPRHPAGGDPESVLPLDQGDGAGETAAGGDARLLADMSVAGLEARIVKVASGGLDESFLWEDVASAKGRARVKRAMQRFGLVPGGAGGGGGGAVIGEGGEFETLVVDGPRGLFRKRIVVDGDGADGKGARVVREGDGTAWLRIEGARVEEKMQENDEGSEEGSVRIPGLLDPRFESVLGELATREDGDNDDSPSSALTTEEVTQSWELGDATQSKLQQWCVLADTDSLSHIEGETSSIIRAVKARLSEASLPATSIVNTVIVLRRMSDFPTINKIYGSLFSEPNPPSRVTISSGDLLPATCNIALYLSVRHGLASGERQGLHVQSRSYWAPANIGPYSQAIAFPLPSSKDTDAAASLSMVHIAGQIPLVPATMDLPHGGPETLHLQLALSLQHLWRIGTEMGVQWWASGVAYLPRSSSHGTLPTRERASLAAQAWRAAHQWSEESDEEDEEGGPDLWDRKFDPRYMCLATSAEAEPHRLPDWSVLKEVDEGKDTGARSVPFMFAAEVDELPRQAGVEWHAHAGLAGLDAASVRIVSAPASASRSGSSSRQLQAQYTVIKLRGSSSFVHTIVALKYTPGAETEKVTVPALLGELGGLVPQHAAGNVSNTPAPVLLYADVNAVSLSADDLRGCPIIPCASLWDARAERLLAVGVYQGIFQVP